MRGQRTVRERSEYSMTVLSSGPAREGIGINTIVLFFSDKNEENIMYLALKAVQWFTICGTIKISDDIS